MSFWGVPVTVARLHTNPLYNDVSTADTLQQMRRVAGISANSPLVRGVANHCLQSTVMGTVRRLYWWIKSHIRFESDENILAAQFGIGPTEADLIIAPDILLQMPQPMGDCDCLSTLFASLLRSLLIPCRFVAIAADEIEPNRWSHVYLKALVDGQWLPLDVSHGSYPGWEYAGPTFRKMEVEI